MWTPTLRTFAALGLAGMVAASSAAAETVSEKLLFDGAEEASDEFGFRNGDFIIAPIPSLDPTLGAGLALGAGQIFKFDEESPTSGIGGVIFGSENGSKAWGVGGGFNFGRGRFRTKLAYGRADVFYDFFGIGDIALPNPIEINQSGDLGLIEGSVRVAPNTYVGVRFRYIDTDVKFPGVIAAGVDLRNLSTTVGNIGLTMAYDSRDESTYPTQGINFQLVTSEAISLDDVERDYRTYTALLDAFLPIGERWVLASRAGLCGTGGQVPFWDLCTLGGFDSFRGYPIGQYRDTAGLSLQAELRGQFTERLGAAVFAGSALFASDIDELFDEEAAWAAGVGGRYRLSKDFKLDFAVDVATNAEGETTTYIYVGQRF